MFLIRPPGTGVSGIFFFFFFLGGGRLPRGVLFLIFGVGGAEW